MQRWNYCVHSLSRPLVLSFMHRVILILVKMDPKLQIGLNKATQGKTVGRDADGVESWLRSIVDPNQVLQTRQTRSVIARL